MNMQYFSKLLPLLHDRGIQSTLGILKLGSNYLRKSVESILQEKKHSLIGDPVFEAVFGWNTADVTMQELESTLLNKTLVENMANPPQELKEDYEFPLDRHPYLHQLAAWKILCSDTIQSAIVTSGTGSGKTECFMIPILHRLAQQSHKEGKLVGVRALFLYPLNALINSQRDRLNAWTHGFGSNIRFCLYNGNTPNSLPSIQKIPNEVNTREDLRNSPPPLLVTNATMLEYMLVRTEDTPILTHSQGKLEWIVLDEAHNYIGSQAAELALLLRRVLLAFNTKPENIRFVATSATIGDPEGGGGERLRQFLADVAGISPSQVHIVAGTRCIPQLSQKDSLALELETIASIEADNINSQNRYEALSASKQAIDIRNLFINKENNGVAKLSEIQQILEVDGICGVDKALRWLDVLSGTCNQNNIPFLPLRAHIFHRTLPGIWACADSQCTHKQIHNGANDWGFGAIWTEMRTHCTCGSPVYEIITCNECRTPYLLAQWNIYKDENKIQYMKLEQFVRDNIDFNFEDELTEDDEESILRGEKELALLVPMNPANSSQALAYFDKDKCILLENSKENAISITYRELSLEAICPHCHNQNQKIPFYTFNFVSAQFLQTILAPTLLEFAPDGKNPANHPYRGRKILTFNDSRQGTARSAMRLQMSAELNRIRGLIYHICIQNNQSSTTEDTKKLEDEITTLKEVKNSALTSLINEKELLLQQLKKPQPISFSKLCEALQEQSTSFKAIFDYYREHDPELFSNSNGSQTMARILLFREFGRRPYRQNNLETMGLVAVQYPELQKISNVAELFSRHGLTIEHWRNFLKICLDLIFRANSAVFFLPEWRRWLGMPCAQNRLLPPQATESRQGTQYWPQAARSKRRNRMVRLLEQVLQCDIDSWECEDLIDSTLLHAWDTLTSTPILKRAEDGFTLDVEQMAFAPITQAWLCPVTNRFLDTTIKGITPYVPLNAKRNLICKAYDMPLYPIPFGKSIVEQENIDDARSWLSKNVNIKAMREEGVWTIIHDRVIELPSYYTAMEHSAQLSSYELEQCTRKFQNGDVNILSCSTTMEMGIDIGGISIVGMNNVPPHPANYLQRAGRAGRRHETRSLAFTICKENPHEMGVFYNARWAFDTALPTPYVSLSSDVIIQRHVNALLLTHFLKNRMQNDDPDIVRLTCEMFFIGETSLARQFSSYFMTIDGNSPIIGQIETLCRYTSFQDRQIKIIIEKTVDSMNIVTENWENEHEILVKQKKELSSSRNIQSPALKALELRIKRLTGEYLLKELVSQGFLPAHGFPTRIATFDNMHVALFKKQFKSRNTNSTSNSENVFRRRELASRDIPTALLEYAPSCNVAINGLVYQSKGITLNWHIPASETNVKEIQNIRACWLCKECGTSGTKPSRQGDMQCPHCYANTDRLSWGEYLEPAGFAVDFYDTPDNNLSKGQYVKASTGQRLTAHGPWVSLGVPEIFRFRTTPQGNIFYYSEGNYGLGYAICLACGRTESVMREDEIPAALQHHRRLRGGKDDTQNGKLCSACQDGGNWKIKSKVLLACDAKTDVLEIQLKNTVGQWLNDKEQAYPIAIALRDSLASCLGIDNTELGYSISRRRADKGSYCYSIFIFDKNAAGYASTAGMHILTMLHSARERLLCHNAQCETVCPQCVLSFDQRLVNTYLDRHKGLEVLTENWINTFELPARYHIFDGGTEVEVHPIKEAIILSLYKNHDAAVCLYVGGESCYWQIGSYNLLSTIDTLSALGKNIFISLDKDFFESCSDTEKMLLLPFLEREKISCVVMHSNSFPLQSKMVASIFRLDSSIIVSWAYTNFEDEESALLLRGKLGTLGLFTKLSIEDLQSGANSCAAQIMQQLDGTLQNFGKNFVSVLSQLLKERILTSLFQHGNLKSIQYSDRYFHSPLVVSLLFQVIHELRLQVDLLWKCSSITFHLDETCPSGIYTSAVWHNWNDADTRNKVIQEVFSQFGNIKFQTMHKKDMPHARKLTLIFEKSQFVIWLDQGFGFMEATSATSGTQFPFSLSPKQQGENIYNMNLNLNMIQGGTVISIALE